MRDQLRIEVPNGARALALARRLGASARLVCSGGGSWEVRLDDAPSARALTAALGTIERWLREERIPEAKLHLDGKPHRMTCR